MDNIEYEVKKLIAEIIEKEPSEIGPDAKFVEDLGIDSMMALEIMASIEKKFKVAIPEDKLTKLTTLNDAIALTKEILDKKGNISA